MEIAILENKRFRPKLPLWFRPIGFRRALLLEKMPIGFRVEKTAFGFAQRVSPFSMPQKLPIGFRDAHRPPARIGR